MFAYTLEIVIPEEFPQVVKVESRLTIGSGSGVDIHGANLSPNHCIFKVKDGILSVLNASGKKSSLLGKQLLKHGKMYILDSGDRLKLEDVEILVGKEKIAPEPVTEDKTAEFTRPRKERTKTRTSLDMLKMEDSPKKGKKKKKKVQAPNTRLKSLIGRTLEGPKPGILVRTLSLATDWTLTYALIYFLIPFLGQENLWQQIVDIIAVTLEPLHKQIPPMVMTQLQSLPVALYHFLIGWFLLELVGNLIFSMPITHAILGMKGTGSFILKRLKAIIRTPLIVLDLLFVVNIQVLFKKKTLKEYLTFSEIYNGNTFIRRLGLLIILPLIMVASLLSPALSNLDFLTTIHKGSLISTSKQKKIAKPQLPFLNFKSRHFQIKAKGIFPEKTKLIPYSTGKKLWIIDPKSGREVLLKKRGKRINFKKMVEIAALSDPLFHFNYSHLLTAGKWNIAKQDDLKNFISELLELNLISLPTYILKHGPFISTHLVAKSMLLKALPESESWERITTKEVDILQIMQIKKGNQTRGFFPLTYPTSQFYWLKTHKKAKKFGKLVATNLYQNAKWSKPPMPTEGSAIGYLDLLYQAKNGMKPELSKTIAKYFKNLADDAEDSKHIAYQAAALNSISDAVKYFGLKNEKKPSTITTQLLQELQMLEIKFKNDIDATKVQAVGLIK